MSEVKVRLSMEVPGATMLRTQDLAYKGQSKKDKEALYNYEPLNLDYKVKKKGKIVKYKETLHIYTRKSYPAKQVMSISKEAYDFMTNGSEIPSTSTKKIWASMSKKQRLDHHCKLIAENFNAISYSFEILDD